jgi:hypothetical protein
LAVARSWLTPRHDQLDRCCPQRFLGRGNAEAASWISPTRRSESRRSPRWHRYAGVEAKKKPAEQSAEQQAAAELVRLAQEQGLSLPGPAGRSRSRCRGIGPEISAHFAEIYGASVSKETISRITDRVMDEMQDWAARPLDET